MSTKVLIILLNVNKQSNRFVILVIIVEDDNFSFRHNFVLIIPMFSENYLNISIKNSFDFQSISNFITFKCPR